MPDTPGGVSLSNAVSPVVLLSPIDSNKKINRYESAAIFGILTFEILKVFDEVLLTINETSADGVLVKFGKRIFVVIVQGSRYYPVLVSLRLQNTFIRFLAFTYVIGILAYTVYRESVCLDFMPNVANLPERNIVQLRIQLSARSIIYGLIANTPYFALLSYIVGEFGIRLMLDSCRGYQQDHG
ncbi:unnamed protein product [Rotaria sordida]|uniref:Uncharacterized protein n=1 Tax=Rotaria sordida TaxID=392033 RepID=A0A815B3G4_9BILA|nr:unnamed protein product [Rotaria sordida]CAF1264820.1 unnamed protein product [Rotaria sordida]CAF3751432.1 unnamed protein product [Rotaria sordida]CAF3858362.1 unnamed protein product [Rotaria sordida]